MAVHPALITAGLVGCGKGTRTMDSRILKRLKQAKAKMIEVPERPNKAGAVDEINEGFKNIREKLKQGDSSVGGDIEEARGAMLSMLNLLDRHWEVSSWGLMVAGITAHMAPDGHPAKEMAELVLSAAGGGDEQAEESMRTVYEGWIEDCVEQLSPKDRDSIH